MNKESDPDIFTEGRRKKAIATVLLVMALVFSYWLGYHQGQRVVNNNSPGYIQK